MFFFRILLMALKGLKTNFFRSFLATVGVIIGVGAVVSAVSILEGAQRDILDQVESMGSDQFMIVNGSRQHSGRQVALPSLKLADVDEIEREAGDLVVAVAPQYQGGGQVKYFSKNVNCQVLGTSDTYAEMNSYEVAEGRFFTEEDVRGRTMVVALGYQVKQDLFGALPAVGKPVKINGKSFTVIGVMEERGVMGFVEVDKQVAIPVSTAMFRMFGAEYLSMIVVKAAATDKVADAISEVRNILRARHRVRAGEAEDFQIFSQQQVQQQFGVAAQIFGIVLYSIAGISLAVGGIGIMNIMMVSVTERTREIGVRIAVGARRMDVLVQFLIESSTISFLGGALGVACGWAIANLLSEITQVLNVYTPPLSIVVALGMAGVVGIVSGIYPAIRASQLDPVQALRYE